MTEFRLLNIGNVTSTSLFWASMDLLTFLRVIVLVANGVYCFIPRGDLEPSATKTIIQQQLQQQNTPVNDISVYDPGVGE